MATCGCNDFSRSQVLRRMAAEAGRGLPSIEPGMPLPAGTGLSRRSFLLRSSGLALAVYGAASLSPRAFEEGIAGAAAQAADERVLVSVFCSGGVDSLTLLAPNPSSHPRYPQLRPTLGLPGGQGVDFAEDPSLRWHPSVASLATLHSEGKLSVLPAIGYDDANQSHFTSRHYWEVGETNPHGRWGWLGRYLDQHGAPDNPLQGLTLGWDLSPSLAAQEVPVACVSRPDEYDFWSPGVWGQPEERMLDAFADLGAPATGDSGLRYAREQVGATSRLREQLEPFQAGYSSPVTYPDSDFARRLAALAAMLGAGLPLKVVALEAHGGYDTHSDQAANLPGDLEMASQSLLAFQRDLESRSLADRVLTHVWSEFGRRPGENGSGTDHGAAGVGLVMGTQAKGQMVGDFPGLASLDADDNLRNTSDFRGVYRALLEDWLEVDAGSIIPGASSFAKPDLVKP
ncbi:MAG: DUF1501 domain-containing protein [Actinomycetota bacterium]|nr:DUF1501 domain-containing protein [Actinomycetota bacterium]